MSSPSPSPPPPSLPERTPAKIEIQTSDLSSELSKSSNESDSEPSVKKQKVNKEEEEEGDALSNYVRLGPLPMEHDYENCCCKLNMPDSDDENVIDKECWNKYLQQLNESEVLVCQFVVMLSEQPSPPPLRLPPPPPQPTPAEIGIVMDDFSSESSECSYVSSVSSDSDSDLELESEVKKQKLNDDEEEEGKGDDDSSDSKKLDPLPMTPDMEDSDSDSDDQFVYDDDGWKKYSQQLQESEGFDIKDYPGADPRVTIFPRPNYLECPSNVKLMKDYAARALKLYNQKFDTLYEVNDILKVNGDDCGVYDVYYITFTVTNGEKEYFQAKVVKRLGRFLRISMVRPRANGASGI